MVGGTARLIVNYSYLMGSFLYLPGSIALYWTSFEALCWSTALFIIASVFFLAGGVVDLWAHFAGPRKACLVLYLVGGIAFTAGSFLFWPTLGTASVGYWFFRGGSASYFSGSILLIYWLDRPRQLRNVAATAQYMGGSCLFVIGGILSQLRITNIAFATIWVVGSLAFTGGALLTLANETCDHQSCLYILGCS